MPLLPLAGRVVPLLVLAACASAPRPSPPPEAGPVQPVRIGPGDAKASVLSPAEIFERIEQSNHYVLDGHEGPFTDQERNRNARALWPEGMTEIDFPRLKQGGPDGSRVVETESSPEITALFEQAEPDYEAHRYAKAERYYRRILELKPGYYPALLEIGNCAYMAGDFQEAVPRFDAAIRANPLDHRGHFYKADALVELGRTDEAVVEYAWALVLRPRHDLLRQGIEARRHRIHRDLRGDLLLPDVMVRQDGPDTVTIEMPVPVQGGHWLAFGSCKAVWLIDADYRRKKTGSPDHAFSTVEEQECATLLLALYKAQREEKGAPEDPRLELLGEIFQAGYGDEFIIFELGTRRAPHLTLLLDDSARRSLHDYVLRYVLVPAK